MNERKIRIGITHGDTNGIGYEVIMKTLADEEMLQLFTPVIYGASKVLSYHRKAIDMQQFTVHNARNTDSLKENAVNLIEVSNGEEVKVELGQPSKAAGKAAFAALEAAVADLKAGRIDALVTAPINKDNIQSEDFHFAGHTEYLQASCDDGHALMILFDEHLRVALVTTHMPLAQVAQAITADVVADRLRTFNAALRRDFGIERPRIAVLALNPHAGENGLLGSEEKEIIAPAIARAFDDEHIMCFGPYPADSFFAMEQYRHFDGVLAMYHDQGLAPLKMIARGEGVNFTAGLPIVRTSPDHGTGYDIAGKNMANPASMRHAIFAAIDICRNRAAYDEAHENPLGKIYEARGKDNVVLDLTQDEE